MIQTISVLGAGTMGHGIANVFAMHGYQVSLYEPFNEIRNAAPATIRSDLEFMADEQYIDRSCIQSTLDRITLFAALPEAVANADYVIEATPEDMALKQKLFQQLDTLCPKHTIFASNTSSLTLSEMTALLPEDRKSRTMVCHWYNPAHLIPIAELSFFGNMSEAVFSEVKELYVRCEKQPVKVLKDIPGLIANRLLHAQAREAFHLIEIGAAAAEDIDRALKFGPGFRSATTGMLEVADMGGLDIWCIGEDNLLGVLDCAPKACDLLREKAAQGKLGFKSGEGFFTYSGESGAAAQTAFNKRLITQLKASKHY